MSRLSAFVLLLIPLGCAGDAELPPVELGGGGARLMNGNARTPVEAYENAYARLGKEHYNVRRNLEGRGQNLYGAREAMASLVRILETLRSLAGPSDQPRFDPYVARYQGWLKDLDRNFWGGSFLGDLDRSETEVKSKFSPANVEIAADFAATTVPPAPAPDPVRNPAPRPSEGVPPDKAVVPTTPPSTPKAAPAPAASAGTARIYYKAWDRAHDDLVAAYKAKKDCRPHYEDLVGALALFKAHATAAQAGKLDIYLQYYAGIHDKTKAFTTLPEGETITEKDILDELDVAARVLRGKEFNPDK